ncbi:hypothetical protein GF362_07110, partial [Candidatus Dojkabacteria bacterium]|nr:hypothetical protein [Candidatus Dojkabacteria bacterium]
MRNRSRNTIVGLFVLTLVLGGVAVFIGTSLETQRDIAPEEGSAHEVGDEWNECCGECLSKHVTCTGTDESGNCNAWDTGPC